MGDSEDDFDRRRNREKFPRERNTDFNNFGRNRPRGGGATEQFDRLANYNNLYLRYILVYF